MNSKLSKTIFISIFALFILSSVLFFGLRKTEVTSDIKIGSNNAPTLLFQPDSQILDNAINPKTEAKSAIPIGNKALPYVYNKNACPDNSSPCFQTFYRNLVKDYGIDVSFSDIKERYNENPVIASNCHPLVHIIGEEASGKYATVSEAYLHGDSFCWSGYYHGILEGVIEKIGVEKLPAKLNSICADIPGKAEYNFNYYNCVHGLGHGIMESLSDEVPKSLVMCDNLSGSWERESCYGGVFMENIIANNKGSVSKYLKKDEPLYPCNSIDRKYKYQCYLGQTSYALEVNGYDFKKVFDMCATVEIPFRNVCNQSMGRDAANQAMHNAEKTKSTCALANDENDRQNCIVGAVKEIISYYHTETQALDFCGILSESDKTICKDTADTYYKLF